MSPAEHLCDDREISSDESSGEVVEITCETADGISDRSSATARRTYRPRKVGAGTDEKNNTGLDLAVRHLQHGPRCRGSK